MSDPWLLAIASAAIVPTLLGLGYALGHAREAMLRWAQRRQSDDRSER